jgi:hypothetical protein
LEKDGDVISAENDTIPMSPIVAGDVNGDHVIDVLDAVAIQKHWGTKERRVLKNEMGNSLKITRN